MKNAYILVEDIYEDMEFWYPYYRLKEAVCDESAGIVRAVDSLLAHSWTAKVKKTIALAREKTK